MVLAASQPTEPAAEAKTQQMALAEARLVSNVPRLSEVAARTQGIVGLAVLIVAVDGWYSPPPPTIPPPLMLCAQ